MIPTENLTEIARDLYAAYSQVIDANNPKLRAMPAWEDLPSEIQLAWEGAAFQAASVLKPRVELEAREQLQVSHALTYFAQFQSSGVPGHGHFMLIAKLAKALGIR